MSTKSKRSQATNKDAAGPRNWPPEDEDRLMNFYEMNQVLWSNAMPNSPDDMVKRNQCWARISEKMGYPVKVLQKRIRTLRTTYTNELNAIRKARSGAKYTVPTPRVQFIFKKLSWLEPFLRPRNNNKTNFDEMDLPSSGDGGLFYANNPQNDEEQFQSDSDHDSCALVIDEEQLPDGQQQNSDDGSSQDYSVSESDSESDGQYQQNEGDNNEEGCEVRKGEEEGAGTFSQEDGPENECLNQSATQGDIDDDTIIEHVDNNEEGSQSNDRHNPSYEPGQYHNDTEKRLDENGMSPEYPSQILGSFDSQPVSPLKDDLPSFGKKRHPLREVSVGNQRRREDTENLSDDSETEPDQSQSVLLAPSNYQFCQSTQERMPQSTKPDNSKKRCLEVAPAKQKPDRSKSTTDKCKSITGVSKSTKDISKLSMDKSKPTTNESKATSTKSTSITNKSQSMTNIVCTKDPKPQRKNITHSSSGKSERQIEKENNNATLNVNKKKTNNVPSRTGKKQASTEKHPLLLTRKSTSVPSRKRVDCLPAEPPAPTTPPAPRTLSDFVLDYSVPSAIPEKYRTNRPSSKTKKTPVSNSAKNLDFTSECDLTEESGIGRIHFKSKDSINPPNTLVRPVERRPRGKRSQKNLTAADEAERLALKQQQLEDYERRTEILATISGTLANNNNNSNNNISTPIKQVKPPNHTDDEKDYFCSFIRSIVSKIPSVVQQHEYMLEVHRLGVQALNGNLGTRPQRDFQQQNTPNMSFSRAPGNLQPSQVQAGSYPSTGFHTTMQPATQNNTMHLQNLGPITSNTSTWLTSNTSSNQGSTDPNMTSDLTTGMSDVATSISLALLN